ncbi:hypothetical protein FE257_007511 [Aspergillus nanangensis]|uniref:Uncharacterized protein n=1 Tax=Aspergillus nanangensis TaxID=2582783 RepID=A0AAD4GV81_ASPNN|nr:hypothetical protein FE257_007511 [Aspergillus nanangensis]
MAQVTPSHLLLIFKKDAVLGFVLINPNGLPIKPSSPVLDDARRPRTTDASLLTILTKVMADNNEYAGYSFMCSFLAPYTSLTFVVLEKNDHKNEHSNLPGKASSVANATASTARTPVDDGHWPIPVHANSTFDNAGASSSSARPTGIHRTPTNAYFSLQAPYDNIGTTRYPAVNYWHAMNSLDDPDNGLPKGWTTVDSLYAEAGPVSMAQPASGHPNIKVERTTPDESSTTGPQTGSHTLASTTSDRKTTTEWHRVPTSDARKDDLWGDEDAMSTGDTEPFDESIHEPGTSSEIVHASIESVENPTEKKGKAPARLWVGGHYQPLVRRKAACKKSAAAERVSIKNICNW